MSGVVVKASPFGGAQQARLDLSGEAIEPASPYVLSPFVGIAGEKNSLSTWRGTAYVTRSA
jgi:hypothetical protein